MNPDIGWSILSDFVIQISGGLLLVALISLAAAFVREGGFIRRHR